MIEKTITFEDLDGNKVTETFSFHLTKADITELGFIVGEDGPKSHIQQILEEEDRAEIIRLFKMLISKSVGRRSANGRSFLKSQQITDEFMGSDAYSELFMELITSTEAAALFINGIFPRGIQEALEEQARAATGKPVETVHNVFTENPTEEVSEDGPADNRQNPENLPDTSTSWFGALPPRVGDRPDRPFFAG